MDDGSRIRRKGRNRTTPIDFALAVQNSYTLLKGIDDGLLAIQNAAGEVFSRDNLVALFAGTAEAPAVETEPEVEPVPEPSPDPEPEAETPEEETPAEEPEPEPEAETTDDVEPVADPEPVEEPEPEAETPEEVEPAEEPEPEAEAEEPPSEEEPEEPEAEEEAPEEPALYGDVDITNSVLVPEEEDGVSEPEESTRADELTVMSRTALNKLAKKADIKFRGVKKDDLVVLLVEAGA